VNPPPRAVDLCRSFQLLRQFQPNARSAPYPSGRSF
jgi:hypothetical protein